MLWQLGLVCLGLRGEGYIGEKLGGSFSGLSSAPSVSDGNCRCWQLFLGIGVSEQAFARLRYFYPLQANCQFF